MDRRDFLKTLGMGTAAMALPYGVWSAPTQRRPNLLLILADDLGWRDLGCYGSTFHETPNLDALARHGMRFTQAYAANPLCSPTRASILTGLYPARIGITAPVCHLPEERLEATLPEKAAPRQKVIPCTSATRLKLEYLTLAEVLREAGYRTAHFGKWHLGPEPYDPLHQGFEVDFPHWSGPGPAGSYVAPWKFPNLQGRPGEHIEERLAEEVVRFIRQHRNEPFFVNYWCYSVHSPWDARKELVEKYRARVDPQNPQRNPLYAAMVESLDTAVGRVMEALRELGLEERTIVIFFSDNGGVDFWIEERMKERYGMEVPPTSNLPLRGGKASLYEGGTRVPCIIVWPGVTPPGSESDAIIQSIDFFPTILEMLEIEPPKGLKLDGISIVPALQRSGPLKREAIFCHFPHHTPAAGQAAGVYVRQGEWKLIRLFHDGPDFAHRYELYNLREDLGETRNLAATMPEKVKELDGLIEAFLKETGAVLPRPNPAYNPRWRPMVQGWRPSGDCILEARDGLLRLESTGGDPHLFAQAPSVEGPLRIRFRMRSTSKGIGQFFWTDGRNPQFRVGHPARIDFKPLHDGAWHEYEIAFEPQGGLREIRLDPCTAPGVVEFDWIRLLREDGTVVQAWEF